MTNIVVDKEEAWTVMMIRANELTPNFEELKKKEPKEWARQEKLIKKVFLNTPAMTIPSMDIIYLHGNIPEDYIELVITHEELHRAVQSVNGVKSEDYQKNVVKIDKIVDSPVLNTILCFYFNIEPHKFMKWLTMSIGQSWTHRLVLRVLYRMLYGIYDSYIKMAKKLWID